MSMNMVRPMQVNDATLISSTVPEDDNYDEWASGTTYSAGDRVILVATHRIYEAAATTTGDSPSSNLVSEDNPGAAWIEVSATNRWKAFDSRISNPVSRGFDLQWVIEPDQDCNTVALLNVTGAAVAVTVVEDSMTIFAGVKSLVDNSAIHTWLDFFFAPIDYMQEAIFEDVPAHSGTTTTVVVSGTGSRKLGELVIGWQVNLGTLLTGSSTGMTDFSRKERDDFGNVDVIERDFIDRVSFSFSADVGSVAAIKRELSAYRAKPAFYHGSNALVSYGMSVFGYFQDFDIPLPNPTVAVISLEVEGLV